MPVAPEDVLKSLQAAVDEARVATREAHEAHKMLRQDLKNQQRFIVDTLTAEVADAVARIEVGAEDAMRERASKVIDQIAADWRAKLGLS